MKIEWIKVDEPFEKLTMYDHKYTIIGSLGSTTLVESDVIISKYSDCMYIGDVVAIQGLVVSSESIEGLKESVDKCVVAKVTFDMKNTES